MKRKLFFILLPVVAVMNCLLVWRGVSAEETGDDDSGYATIAVFTRALQLIRQDYVDEKKVSYRDLIYGAMKGMLAQLDPHSAFMEPQDFKSMQDDTKGDFGGLGIVVSMKDGVLTIVSPMEGTPGFKAGLMPGDQILKINGNSTEKLDTSGAVGMLRGEPGQPVTLTILRPSTNEIKDYSMERDVIRVDSVKGTRMLPVELTGDYKIGYVRITQFNAPTGEELAKALDALEAQGMQALVLDLRYNPGGLLTSAVDVCAQFVKPNEMVVYTEGRAPSQRKPYRTPPNSKPRPNYPVTILINGGSASGSEIVAGALKDLNRAVLVGETTFGKGSVQSVVGLPDGSALRLTTAKYYTPSKTVIHEHGVVPHIRVTLSPKQERAVIMARRQEDALDDETRRELEAVGDAQLERAVDALKGLMRYDERKAPAAAAKPVAAK